MTAPGRPELDCRRTQPDGSPASAAAPRHHAERSVLAGAGLPGDRQARIAARRAFVNLKLTYLAAVDAAAASPRADWLRHQIRQAALRAAVFEALPAQACRAERDSLQRGIAAVFPRTSPDSGFAPLF